MMNKFSNVFKTKSFVFKDKLKDYLTTSLSSTNNASNTTSNSNSLPVKNGAQKQAPAK